MLAGLLTLAGCQVHHPTQDNLPKPSAVPIPAVSPMESAQPTASPAPTPPASPASAPAVAPAAMPATVSPTTPAAKPATNTTKVPSKPSTQSAAASSGQQKTAPEPKSATAAPPSTSTAAKPASLDLDSLEQRLKDTHAIGVFTKLSLKNQVDDLLDDLREFHKGASKLPQSVLRQKYDLLIMKVLSLLQNGDPPLASAISSSREAIWQILMDPGKFAKI
jgi:hypothetical protein